MCVCVDPPHNGNLTKQLGFYPKASLFESQMDHTFVYSHVSCSVAISITWKLVKMQLFSPTPGLLSQKLQVEPSSLF